jgi:hypothetical protein
MNFLPILFRVAFYPPVHPEYARALRILDAFDMPYADAWRMLRPVAVRLGIPRPSYSTVRRLAIAERERKRRHADDLDLLLTDLFKGRFPLVWVEHKLIGVRTLPARPGGPARPPPRGGGP